MSSRGKNFRRRSESVAEANAEEKPSPSPAVIPSVPKITSNVQLKNSRPSQGPKRLSFEDEEEDERPTSIRSSVPTPSRTVSLSSFNTPSYTRSSASSIHRLTTAKDRTSPHVPMTSNVHPQVGEYTKERLLELQKNARPLASKPSRLAPSLSESKLQNIEAPSEPIIILKGLVKPVVDPDVVQQKQTPEDDDSDKDYDDGESAQSFQFKKMAIGKKMIPDQETIKAIRSKREQLRQSRGAAPDYISLDGDGLLTTQGPESGSSDEEAVDVPGRIALFGDKNDGHAKKGVFEDIDERITAIEPTRVRDVGGLGAIQNDIDEDEDEEERKWEEEQFRKGLGKRIDDAQNHRGASGAILPASLTQPPASMLLNSLNQASSSSISYMPSSGLSPNTEAMTIFQQAEVATRAMQENINKLKQTHSRTVNSLTMIEENLSESLLDITTLETSFKDAGDKFLFMQKLRHFISIICDFLQDKAPFIEELEEQMQKLHEERASAVSERRSADFDDEYGVVEAAVSASMAVLSKGSGSEALSGAASTTQDAAVAARDNSSLRVQLDEFGRDVNLQKRMNFERRAEARKRRRAKSDAKRMSQVARDGKYQRVEGESSTDESENEINAYNSSRDELLITAKSIFSDAADAYSKLSDVKTQFEKWKKQYQQSYHDAYMSLSCPTIFAPFVRVELLGWDPLHDPVDFNNMNWHEELFEYGVAGEGVKFDPDDVDTNLVPVLVEKVALPILHHEIVHCWDILSSRQTKNAVFATDLVINYVSPSSDALRDLLTIIRSRLLDTVTTLDVPTWDMNITRAIPGAARLAAYRFGVSVRLLGNICLWKDILALPVLEKLVLEELLNKKLLPHLRSAMQNIHDAITKMERILAALSGVWFGPGVLQGYAQKLHSLVECLMQMSRRLEKRQSLGVGEEETVSLARRLKKMMVEMGEYDRARSISRTFHLKEAL